MPARNDDARDDDVSTRLERCGPYPEPSCDQNIADAVGAVIRPTTAWQRWVITVEWVDPPGRRRTDRRGRRNCRTGPFRRTPVWFAGSAIRAGLPVLSRADGLGGRGGDVWSDTHARIGVIGTGLDRCGVVFSLRTRAGGVNAGEPQTAPRWAAVTLVVVVVFGVVAGVVTAAVDQWKPEEDLCAGRRTLETRRSGV